MRSNQKWVWRRGGLKAHTFKNNKSNNNIKAHGFCASALLKETNLKRLRKKNSTNINFF
jgi:hypothetical protein